MVALVLYESHRLLVAIAQKSGQILAEPTTTRNSRGRHNLLKGDMNLNSEQQTAVNAREGYWQVVAGPGSGKTRCLTERYKALLDAGEDPAEILSLTFTKNAAQEMRKRAEKEADGGRHSKICSDSKGKISTTGRERPSGFLTFHSLALAFCQAEREAFGYDLAPFPLLTPGQAAKIIGEAARPYALDYRAFSNWLHAQKNAGKTPWQAREDADCPLERSMASAYEDYEKKCRERGVLDFDSMLTEMVRVLKASISGTYIDLVVLAARWQYKWIQVDESQDANSIQWELVKCLSSLNHNVFAVGDGKQAVYEWRGAHPDLFVHFPDLFLGAKTLYLGTNYRSTPQIVDFIRDAAPVRNELLDHFHTDNPAGPEVSIRKFYGNRDEADTIASENMKPCTVAMLQNMAVLARTNRILSSFEEALINAGVKYYLLGKAGFWSQREVQDVLAFCQCAVLPHDGAVTQALRSPFACTRFIRKTEVLAAAKRPSGQVVVNNPLFKYLSELPNQAEQGFASTLRSLR